jgi:1,2-diacylglycerol 3-alpha-glucosyltransferase
MPVKIALLTETWHPYTNGVITHIEVLAAGLRSLGHQVFIIASDPNTRRHYTDEDGVLRCPGLKLKRIYGYGIASPFSRERFRILKAFQPDIIHIHNEFSMGTFGMLSSKQLKVPLVYTLHTAYDDYLHYLAPPPLVPVVRALSHGYVRFLANAAAVSTGPSDKAADYLKARRVSTPFVYIPNSVDQQRFNPQGISTEARQKIRQSFNIPETHTVAIFVGRLGKEKSVAELLDYWKISVHSSAPLHLLVVGDGPERETLESSTAENGIAHQVTFTGKISYENMPQYYGAADLFVSASLTEMMSIALLEAQAMGLPALQRHDPWSENQVLDGVNGFVYSDAATFGTQLEVFSRLNEAEWTSWRQRCRDYVSQQGAEDSANRLLKIYHQAFAETS